MWKESLYKPEYCETAVEVLSQGKSLAAVCVACGVCRSTLYNWRDAHPDFKSALSFGVQVSQSHWEDVGYSGTTGVNPDFCATPWVFTMKARFHEDYAEKRDESKSLSDSIVEKLIDKL